MTQCLVPAQADVTFRWCNNIFIIIQPYDDSDVLIAVFWKSYFPGKIDINLEIFFSFQFIKFILIMADQVYTRYYQPKATNRWPCLCDILPLLCHCCKYFQPLTSKLNVLFDKRNLIWGVVTYQQRCPRWVEIKKGKQNKTKNTNQGRNWVRSVPFRLGEVEEGQLTNSSCNHTTSTL